MKLVSWLFMFINYLILTSTLSKEEVSTLTLIEEETSTLTEVEDDNIVAIEDRTSKQTTCPTNKVVREEQLQ